MKCALVALKCEVGRGYVNDAITVVNFGECIAHNVYINYRGLCNICKKYYYTEFWGSTQIQCIKFKQKTILELQGSLTSLT